MHKLTTNTCLDMDYEYKCDGLSALYPMPSILGILYEVKKTAPTVEKTSGRSYVCL